jgi:hypothetical protein
MGALAEIQQDPTHRGTYNKKADTYVADLQDGDCWGDRLRGRRAAAKVLVLRIDQRHHVNRYLKCE